MEAKHTPGPWHVLLSNGVAFEIGDDSNPNKANVLCTRYGWEERAAEMLANGRLMAAAPDLLEAARKALTECVDLIATPAGEALEAAIAKATGSAA